jgi:acid-sensing ion channel, other
MHLQFPLQNGRNLSVNDYPLTSSSRSGNGLKIFLKRNNEIFNDDICKIPAFLVHSPFELPASYDNNEKIEFYYGYEYDILITPEIIRTDEALKSYKPIERGCFFQGEKELKYFKIYTRRNCELECYAAILLEEVDCIPFHMVRNETVVVCDHRDEEDVQYEDYYTRRQLHECGCLDECDSVSYSFQVNVHSMADFNESLIKRGFSQELFEAATFATLEFRFNDVLIAPLRRYQPFTFSEFLAQSGGMMGLFAGISALSIIELFYFLSLRWMVNLWRWMTNK